MSLRFCSAGTPMDRRDVLRGAGIALESVTPFPAFLHSAATPGFAYTSADSPLLFPQPRKMKVGEGHFVLDNQTALILTTVLSANDLQLSRCLVSELREWYDLTLRPRQVKEVPEAVPGFENAFGDAIPNNAAILKAISYTRARG